MASAPSPSTPSAAGATELVTRPEPGLARGKWEAPRAAFYVVIVLVVALAIVATLRKLGVFARLGKKP